MQRASPFLLAMRAGVRRDGDRAGSTAICRRPRVSGETAAVAPGLRGTATEFRKRGAQIYVNRD
jgi:hypothetical protein